MATYTIELKNVVEYIFNPSSDSYDWEQPYHEVVYNHPVFGTIIYGKLPFVEDWSKIGLGTYPIFDEAYRDVLNGKILDAYFDREIGVETIDKFLLYLRRKMDQIMPYWNNIYESEFTPYEALQTMDIHSVSSNNTEEVGNVTAENSASSNSDSKSRAVTSSTPQTILSGNGDYATGASDTNSEADSISSSEQSSDSSNSTEFTGDNRVTGFQGISSDLVMRYRASLLNIDLLVIEAIEECFMQILNSGDSYTNSKWYY